MVLDDRQGGAGHAPPAASRGPGRFVGDPVALVVAETRYLAEDAADFVEVDYEPLTPVVDYAAGQRLPTVHEGYERNIAGRLRGGNRDELDEVFGAAAHVVAEEIHEQAYAAVPIETRGLVVEWSSGEMTIWAATQAPHEVRGSAPDFSASTSTGSE